MAITVQGIETAKRIEIVVQVYMLGGLNKEETADLIKELVKLKVSLGDQLLFRYPVLDPNNPTLSPRWYTYAVRCPKCRKPAVYFFEDFGPGCSGMNGGWGCKVPREKRPWYDSPYVHEGEAQAPPPKKK